MMPPPTTQTDADCLFNLSVRISTILQACSHRVLMAVILAFEWPVKRLAEASSGG
jgi:hypothetical protein